MSAAMEAAMRTLDSYEGAELRVHLTKDVGFGIGLELKDSHMSLKAKNSNTV